MPPAPNPPAPPPCMPIWASTGTPANPAGSRSDSGRSLRLVTITCADRESFGMNFTSTSPAASAASTSWISVGVAAVTRLDSRAKAEVTIAAVRGSAMRKRIVTMVEPRGGEGEPPLEGSLGQAAIDRRRRHALVCNRISAQEKSRFWPKKSVVRDMPAMPGANDARETRINAWRTACRAGHRGDRTSCALSYGRHGSAAHPGGAVQPVRRQTP